MKHGQGKNQDLAPPFRSIERLALTSGSSAPALLIGRFAHLDWLNKLCLHVAWQFNTAHNVRPELKRRRFDQGRVEHYGVKIIVQKGAPPALLCVARCPDTGATLTPMASATDVLAGWIGEKDVSASVSALGSTLQSSGGTRQGREIGVVIDRNQHVGIFRIVFVSCQ